MLENIRQISILNKVFNVNDNEWTRVVFAWLFRFFYRVGFVVGWTVIIGMFVSKYGIKALPFLFVANALFTILGSFIYSILLEKFTKSRMIFMTLLFSCVALFLTTTFVPSGDVLFFAFILVIEAFFLVHLKVLFDGYVEEMFTPLESERTFPLIEAAETFGGILAGIVIVFFSYSLETFNFVYFWIFALLIVALLLFIYEKVVDRRVVLLETLEEEKNKSSVGIFSKFTKELLSAKNRSFIFGLFLIVFAHWFLFNLLEYQYTKAVYQSVSNVVMDTGSGFEHALVHDLGELFVLFSVSSLAIQLFLGSRLISYLGVVGSMILHPLVSLLSFLGLGIFFNFPTAVLAKNNFTITTIVYTNAYHSSYYAIKEHMREHIRVILEGVVRPLGAVFATLGIILLQKLFDGQSLVFSVNILLIVVAIGLFYMIYREQDKYTESALADLMEGSHSEERRNAAEILAQRGHRSVVNEMSQVLLKKEEPVALKIAILRAFAELRDIGAIPAILKCLHSNHVAIKEAALDALDKYISSRDTFKKEVFTEYKIAETLKDFYKKESIEEIRLKIISSLSKLSPLAAFDFLLNIIQKSHGNLKASAIHSLKNYQDEHIVAIALPYLKSKNSKYKISAAIALGNLKEFEDEVLYTVYSFVHTDDPELIIYGLDAIGELNLKRQKKVCHKFVNSENIHIKMHAIIALAKMGYKEVIPIILDLLFKEKEDIARELKKLVRNVDVRIYKNVDKIARGIANEEIKRLLKNPKLSDKRALKREELVTLKWLYYLIEEHDEVELIEKLIKNLK